MHKSLLLVPLFVAACSYPRFSAQKTVEETISGAAAARLLQCETHNGAIEVTGENGRDTIELRAEITVRGHTQEEADDRLHLVGVGHELDGDTLRVYGDYPKGEFRSHRPSFAFTMRVPAHLALELETHNGHVVAEGTSGELSVETHNGAIRGDVGGNRARLETHNGAVELRLMAAGDVDGEVVTHNGRIHVVVAEDASCVLDARTHNGRIEPPATIHDARMTRSSLRCRLGDGPTDGRLELVTHNGGITIEQRPRVN